LTSAQVGQSAIWLTTSWFVSELSSKHSSHFCSSKAVCCWSWLVGCLPDMLQNWIAVFVQWARILCKLLYQILILLCSTRILHLISVSEHCLSNEQIAFCLRMEQWPNNHTGCVLCCEKFIFTGNTVETVVQNTGAVVLGVSYFSEK